MCGLLFQLLKQEAALKPCPHHWLQAALLSFLPIYFSLCLSFFKYIYISFLCSFSFLSKLKKYVQIVLPVCKYVHHVGSKCPWRSEEHKRSPATGVMDGFKPLACDPAFQLGLRLALYSSLASTL